MITKRQCNGGITHQRDEAVTRRVDVTEELEGAGPADALQSRREEAGCTWRDAR